ncbi:hypothetical protein SLEP1_g23202 [Rubroshorea leprosula]|uniref:Uncharacterized protein n=1 Tax=Rubroshorea leprosula TaxID=152421 RepID=A0AAV5JM06_9ROSI|nr:hypothetical protein SLEP1_g23202 [Rubroshorea leprosula]
MWFCGFGINNWNRKVSIFLRHSNKRIKLFSTYLGYL